MKFGEIKAGTAAANPDHDQSPRISCSRKR
jgi:hypothetical protein